MQSDTRLRLLVVVLMQQRLRLLMLRVRLMLTPVPSACCMSRCVSLLGSSCCHVAVGVRLQLPLKECKVVVIITVSSMLRSGAWVL